MRAKYLNNLPRYDRPAAEDRCLPRTRLPSLFLMVGSSSLNRGQIFPPYCASKIRNLFPLYHHADLDKYPLAFGTRALEKLINRSLSKTKPRAKLEKGLSRSLSNFEKITNGVGMP